MPLAGEPLKRRDALLHGSHCNHGVFIRMSQKTLRELRGVLEIRGGPQLDNSGKRHLHGSMCHYWKPAWLMHARHVRPIGCER